MATTLSAKFSLSFPLRRRCFRCHSPPFIWSLSAAIASFEDVPRPALQY
jgi:hypothetical protein